MAIVFDSDAGTISGLSVGGLPDGIVDGDMLAANAITAGKIVDGTIVNADINSSAAIAGSKINGSFGKVLQVVEGTHATNETTTSTSYVATGLDAVITPSATSSKILVNITFPADFEGSVTHSGGDYAIYRDSTHILPMNGDSYYTNQSGGGNVGVNASLQKLDSPNSTSAITYKLYMRARNSNTTMKSCHNGGMGTVTLMEIGA